MEEEEWQFHTDVSGQHIGNILKRQKGQDFLTLEYGTDMLSRNVGTPRNISEEHRSQNYALNCKSRLHFTSIKLGTACHNQTFFNQNNIFKKSSPF